MNVTSCPSCENRINVSGQVLVGQIVSCQKCYEVFKVISTNPLTLDFVDVEPEVGYNSYSKPSAGGKKNKKSLIPEHFKKVCSGLSRLLFFFPFANEVFCKQEMHLYRFILYPGKRNSKDIGKCVVYTSCK